MRRDDPPEQFAAAGWVVVNAFDDGTALFACPNCQMSQEKMIVRHLDGRS